MKYSEQQIEQPQSAIKTQTDAQSKDKTSAIKQHKRTKSNEQMNSNEEATTKSLQQ